MLVKDRTVITIGSVSAERGPAARGVLDVGETSTGRVQLPIGMSLVQRLLITLNVPASALATGCRLLECTSLTGSQRYYTFCRCNVCCRPFSLYCMVF
jgi:hypothetical protein